MRFFYGGIAYVLWSLFIATLLVKGGIIIDRNTYLITTAIVVAGAMAGGG